MKSRSFLPFLLICICVAGCGAPLGQVSGTITVNGEPKGDLIVSFTPQGGGTSAAAPTNEKGEYVLTSILGEGIPPGNYKVSITTKKNVINEEADYSPGSYDPNSYGQQAQAAMEQKFDEQYDQTFRASQNAKDPIPAQYNKETTLETTIKAGEQVCDFDLTI